MSFGVLENTSFPSQLKNGHSELVLCYTKMVRIAKEKHSSFLRKFVRYEENKVLWLLPQV
jgi:hypothetical protein